MVDSNSSFYNKIKKNIQRFKGLIKQENLECYRLYAKDIPEFPYIIDIYKNNAVIYEKGVVFNDENFQQIRHIHHNQVNQALEDLLGITQDNIFWKLRTPQKDQQYEKTNSEKIELTVMEGKFKLKVNLTNYIDTGLFLDHRPLRKYLLKNSMNKAVLNLFCYTGSLSVAAAMGGGIVQSVDKSNTYLHWTMENFKLNKLDCTKHQFIKVDILKWLKKKPETTFDLIILDPPSFSNSTDMDENLDIQRDHYDILINLIPFLNPSGILIFSTNKRSFKLNASQLSEKFMIKDITHWTLGIDSERLKSHICFHLTLKT